jgi:hypothetical protein
MALGLAAELLGDLDDAVEHFERAIAVCDRVGAPVYRADAAWALARVLASRGSPGDAERAAVLAHDATLLADAVGVALPLSGVAPPIVGGADADGGERTDDARSSGPSARRVDEMWVITFDGREVQVRHGVGIEHLIRLLELPRQERHVLDLSGGWAAGERPSSRIEVLDDRARQAYRSRIADLRAALDDADADGDAGRSREIQDELDTLTDELRRAMGLGGRARSMNDDNERARVAVTKALRSTIRRIAERHPILGQHLEQTIRTGTFCSYESDLHWQIER